VAILTHAKREREKERKRERERETLPALFSYKRFNSREMQENFTRGRLLPLQPLQPARCAAYTCPEKDASFNNYSETD